jgi:hypothetical protein
VITTLVLAVTFEPLKKRLEAYAERFRDEPSLTPPREAVPDDELVEAVALRVAALLREDRREGP